MTPQIEKSTSFFARFSGTKHRGPLRFSTSGPGKEVNPTGSCKLMKFPDAEVHTGPTTSTESRSSPSTRAIGDNKTMPAQPKRATIISNAIFDDLFDVEPINPSSRDSSQSNAFQISETSSSGRRVASKKQHTVPSAQSSSPGSQRPISDRHDYPTREEVIEPGRVGSDQTTIFDAMLRFSFQDVEGKWQPSCGTGILIGYQTVDASLAEVSQFSGSFFGIPRIDVKGKKPVYHGLIENFDNISSMVAECTAGALPHEPSTSAHRKPDTSSTALKCTCTPTDAKLALELYLETTKKQHKQLGRGLRRVGGVTNFLSISTEDVDLVQKLLELYSRVRELARLVVAEGIVSSVTLTEIHGLMDKALTPISEYVSILYGEMMTLSLADDGWRSRRRAMKQRMKKDWGPRMRALSARVDQAEAWARLVGIRITRAGLEW